VREATAAKEEIGDEDGEGDGDGDEDGDAKAGLAAGMREDENSKGTMIGARATPLR